MKAFTRVTAVLLVLALAFSLAGCGQDITWVAKKGETSIPVGVYIYYLDNQAYAAKQEKVADKTVPVLDQEIDGQPAGDWIVEEAKKDVKKIIAANEWMEELDVEVDKEDENAARGGISQYWEMYYKDYYEEMGIASSSYFMAADLQSLKETAIFKAIYDQGGTKEIPKTDVIDYYLDNYYNISKISAPLYDAQTGQALSDEYIATLQENLAQYAKDIEDGKRTFAEVQASYEATVAAASSDAATSDETAAEDSSSDAATSDASSSDATSSADTSSDAVNADDANAKAIMGVAELTFTESTDVKVDPENETNTDMAIKAMKVGDTQVINDGNEIYLCVKHDTQKTKDAFYDNEDSRLNVLVSLKQEEFQAELDKRVDETEGVEFNEAVLRKYRPKSPEVDSSAETSEEPADTETSDEAASGDATSTDTDTASGDETSTEEASGDESTADETSADESSDTTTETSE